MSSRQQFTSLIEAFFKCFQAMLQKYILETKKTFCFSASFFSCIITVHRFLMSIFLCVRFIFVNYNAWQYSGSNELCAGMVASLNEKIEDEFGAFVTRIFRTLSLDLVEKSTSNFTSLLIQFENNQPTKNELHKIKTLKKILGENFKFSKLQDWETRNNCIVDISNKEKCWVIKCYGEKLAKEAHNRL